MKLSAHLRLIIIGLFLFPGYQANAFRPVGHIVLQRTIAQQLPQDNIFKKAMDSFPVFAAWGAIGPDLTYIPFKPLTFKSGYKRKWALSSNNADIAHYYLAGSFCKALIDTALRSNDYRLIAFAAGWITHVAGDFGAHGLFVYPEAGYYLDDHNGQSLHGELERAAESIIFIEKGKLLEQNKDLYNEANLNAKSIYSDFFGMPYGVFKVHKRKREIKKHYLPIDSLLRKVFRGIYGEELNADIPYLMKHYDEALGKGVGKVKGFKIITYNEAREVLTSTQKTNLESAFNYASSFGQKLLEDCQNNHFEDFSDAWNLDVGNKQNTLVIKTKIGEGKYSGSKNPLAISLKLNTTHQLSMNFKIAGSNVRYRKNDALYSYIYLNNCDLESNKRYRFIVSKVGKVKDATSIESITIYHNGKVVYQSKAGFKLNRKKPISDEFILDLPIILN